MAETGTKRKRASTKTKLATSETETTRADIAEGGEEGLRELIARRAYEIAHSDGAGSDEENWLRAEQEIRSSSTSG
jgi:hypothetical protein